MKREYHTFVLIAQSTVEYVYKETDGNCARRRRNAAWAWMCRVFVAVLSVVIAAVGR